MLPLVKKVKLSKSVFPATWQTVIFRNYGIVSVDKLAKTLSCSEERVQQEAERLGLIGEKYNPVWEKRGYITLIRNNWHLLPYEQLLTLLGISESRLDFILQNDDFLSVKLGGYKPLCEKVSYSPLTEDEIKLTETLAQTVEKYTCSHAAAPFTFFDTEEQKGEAKALSAYPNGVRIVHGYLSPCGDAFKEDSATYMPDALLQQYAEKGVNGVWLHGVLSALSPYPFDESLSAEYPLRRKNLKSLIDRCKGYGIKVYLYFNEPRALPENKLGKYAHLKGRTEDGYAALCLSQKQTQEYLYIAVKDLLSDVKDLGGIITITMSENLTHCNYRPQTNCPICKNIPPEESAAKVNNIIQKAIRDSGSNAELIANLWGWSPYMEWTEEQTLRGVELLDKDVSVMCVSEYDLEIEKGGVKSKIIDYSIANPGPSEITKKTLKKAAETGHKIYAKIQTNNSWECSAVPYLPVFDLTYEHLQNLEKIGVKDYMLTWTLGGYPSPMLGMIAEYVQKGADFRLDAWYEKEYGAEAPIVSGAVQNFCDGFREYPFSIQGLYFSPKTLGCSNLWSLEGEEKQSTMVCYAYDDYENWTDPYPYEVYISQYEKLLQKWEKGCEALKKCESKKAAQLQTFSQAALAHFKSDYLQTKFAYLKREKGKNAQAIKDVIEQEKENTLLLLRLVYENACIGFEASNHYYYTNRNLIEKLLLMNNLNALL